MKKGAPDRSGFMQMVQNQLLEFVRDKALVRLEKAGEDPEALVREALSLGVTAEGFKRFLKTTDYQRIPEAQDLLKALEKIRH